MYLTCPSCLARLQIAAEKIPPRGAWARCPKCKEKFVVKPEGQGLGLLDDPTPSARPPAHNLNRPRTPEEQRLLERLGRNKPQSGPTPRELAEMPVIYPDVASRLTPGCTLLLVAPAVVFSLVLLISLKMAMYTPPREVVELPAVGAQPPKPYDRAAYDRDLLAIRRNINANYYHPYRVTGVGPERRALLYLLNSCGPATDMFVLESLDIEPDGGRTSLNGITVTFNYSGRLRRRLYLSFNERQKPSQCL